MRFRLGLTIGFGVGYVLGAQAGRERYEQIIGAVERWRGSEQGQQFEATVKDVASSVTDTVQTLASETVEQVTDKARDLVASEDDAGEGTAGGGNGAQPAAQGGLGSS